MEENNNLGLYNVQQESEESSSLNFKTIYTTLILNWNWFVLSIIICLGAAAIYLRYATPRYQAHARLLIKDENNYSNSRSSNMLRASSTLGTISNSNGIDNEMEILKSASLAQQTVRDLKLYVTYMQKGRVKDHLLYLNQPVNVDIDPAHLEKLARPISLTINREGKKYVVTGNYTFVPDDRDKAPVEYSINKSFDNLPATINTSVGIISLNANSSVPMPESVTLMVKIQSPTSAAWKYVGGLSITQASKTTTIAELVLRDEIPQRAVDYLRQLSVCYNRQANEDKNEIAMRTEKFINSRLAKINNELGQTEGQLESTKRRYNIVSTEMNSAQSVANQDAYNQKLAEANTQMELLRSLSDYISEPGNRYQTLPSNVGLADPTATMLINKHNEIVMERNRLLRSASESSPTVAPLTAQLDELHSSIRRAMSQARRNMEIQRDNIAQQYNKYSGMVSSTPEQDRILTQIGRQQEVKSGLYLMLLQKREENSISLAATADKGRLLDDPQFAGKISPKSSIIMASALAVGVVLPAVILFLVGFFRYKIEGHDDVARLTSLPIIGDVAIASETAKTKADIVVHENQNNLMEEVFRSMRVNLQFMLKDNQKVIMFTSSNSGEGKTFTAANLAVSFALLDKKVVLVGLDIRKPRLAELFEINDHHHGITPLLTRGKVTKEDVREQILESGINKNLDLLMAGPIPPNPTELISRPALEDTLNILKEEYDYVLIDTAPVGLVTDTLQIGRIADVTVYMCRADYTPKACFQLINQLNTDKKLPQMCVVINGIDMSKKKYGYYYGYGKYGRYSRYGNYGNKSYGSYGTYGGYGTYGTYRSSSYSNEHDDSIKQ